MAIKPLARGCQQLIVLIQARGVTSLKLVLLDREGSGLGGRRRRQGFSVCHGFSRCAPAAAKTSPGELERCFIQRHSAENKRYALGVPIADSDVQAARRQLERILTSAGFSRNTRMARFLRFVVEQHLEGRDGESKESVIAAEIFGRPDHDPRQDSIVRTEAARLRARLGEYYLAEGRNDALIIELPKGGYVPVFRHAAVDPATTALSPGSSMQRLRTGFRLWVALAGVAVAAAALGWWWYHYPTEPIPIAVLPLTNLSADSANDHFADGLTNEIIRNLSIIDGLAVRSQTSSFAYRGRPRDVREAGRQLGADYILEGSVLRAGQQLRINTQLIRVRDDFPLWSEKFDRELTDVFAIQDEIARGIVNSLRLKLGAADAAMRRAWKPTICTFAPALSRFDGACPATTKASVYSTKSSRKTPRSHPLTRASPRLTRPDRVASAMTSPMR